jgi:dTDP-4-amino-4,6-dideoxygalactose transaminase
MINYNRQYITKSDILSVIKVLKSKNITKGPAVKEFEGKLGKYFGSKHCLALSNATSAFYLLSKFLNWKKKI